MRNDPHGRLRELRASVSSAMRELESLSADRRLTAGMRWQLSEAITYLDTAASLLKPLPGHRVMCAAEAVNC
jgi:hypothetical protein